MAPFEQFVAKARDEARKKGLGELEIDAFVLGQLQLEASKRFRAFASQVGDRAYCKSCGAEIFWVTHLKTGRKAPYDTTEGLNHFATCPNAEDFRSKR